jgi:hypothetical protein
MEWKFGNRETRTTHLDGIGSYEYILKREGIAIVEIGNNPSKKFISFYYNHFYSDSCGGFRLLKEQLNEI